MLSHINSLQFELSRRPCRLPTQVSDSRMWQCHLWASRGTACYGTAAEPSSRSWGTGWGRPKPCSTPNLPTREQPGLDRQAPARKWHEQREPNLGGSSSSHEDLSESSREGLRASVRALMELPPRVVHREMMAAVGHMGAGIWDASDEHHVPETCHLGVWARSGAALDAVHRFAEPLHPASRAAFFGTVRLMVDARMANACIPAAALLCEALQDPFSPRLRMGYNATTAKLLARQLGSQQLGMQHALHMYVDAGEGRRADPGCAISAVLSFATGRTDWDDSFHADVVEVASWRELGLEPLQVPLYPFLERELGPQDFDKMWGIMQQQSPATPFANMRAAVCKRVGGRA